MASFRDRMLEKTKKLPDACDIVIEPPKILEDGTVVLTRKETTPLTAVGAHFQRYQYHQLITQLKQRAREENIDIDKMVDAQLLADYRPRRIFRPASCNASI